LLLSASSDSNGRFVFDQIHCPSPAAQVYITAAGGLSEGCVVSNDKLTLMAALGKCSDLQSGAHVAVNQLSTAASVNALAPYVQNKRLPTVGSRLTNANQLANAFAEAQHNEVSPSSASLSDALAACARCWGSGSAACESLMAISGDSVGHET